MAAYDVRERIVRKNTLAHCPFSCAIERLEAYLRLPRNRHQLAALMGARALSALVVEDFTDDVRRHDALELRWHPRFSFFPVSRALLTVRPHAPGAEMQFSIAYVPPFSTAGRFFDLLIGRHIASITIQLLLFRLRTAIERSMQQRRA
jgi:hypothetical protein